MHVLVTGGAGFIGSHLIDAHIARGDTVTTVDDLSKGKQDNVHPSASFHQVDICDAAGLEKIFAKNAPDVVNHHAAQTDVRHSMRDPSFYTRVNVMGFINLLELCRRFQVKKVLFASTCAVYPETVSLPASETHPVRPASHYGLTKYFGEQLVQFYRETYGLGFTVFRYGNVYGPRQDPKGEAGVVAIFASQMFSGVRPTLFGDGNKTRDYIYIDDIVAANLLASGDAANGEVLNLGWGQEIRDLEVFEAVQKAVAWQGEAQYAQKRPGEVDRIALESGKAKRLLGWMPRVSFEKGIERTVRYNRQQQS